MIIVLNHVLVINEVYGNIFPCGFFYIVRQQASYVTVISKALNLSAPIFELLTSKFELFYRKTTIVFVSKNDRQIT